MPESRRTSPEKRGESMTEITSVEITSGEITEQLGVYDLDSELNIICFGYGITSSGSSTHHTTRLTYDEAWKLCNKIMRHIANEWEKGDRLFTLEGGDICE